MIRQRPSRNERHERWVQIIGLSILGGIFIGLFIDKCSQPLIFVREAEAATTTPEIRVQIEVQYNTEGKIRLIRETFPNEPNTAVAIAKAEGGLKTEVQSNYYRNGVREPSFCTFQVHEPSWMKLAKSLGYGDYKTNFESCVAMAKIIYERNGNRWTDWSVYNDGSYKKYL